MSDDEAFADGTPLVELFGGGVRPRIISVLVDEWSRELSISEIARQAGVSRKAAEHHLDTLESIGVVVRIQDTGSSERYQLVNNELGGALYQLDGLTLRQLIQRGHRRDLAEKFREMDEMDAENFIPLEDDS